MNKRLAVDPLLLAGWLAGYKELLLLLRFSAGC
jgi:hypothetical protein